MDFSNELPSLFVDVKDGIKCAVFESMNLEQVPVDGIVQPPTVPSDEKPHRNTDALQYVLNVLKIVSRHRHAWPFMAPVDTIKLCCPDYHTIVKYPMDLTTVKKRIENCYYYDVKECIKDVQMIFYNCYKYNKPTTVFFTMAQNIERLFVKKMADCPKEEKELPMVIKSDSRTPKRKIVKSAIQPKVHAVTVCPTQPKHVTSDQAASSSKAKSGVKRKADESPAHSPVNVVSPISPLNTIPQNFQNTSLHSIALTERQIQHLANNSSNPMEYCHAILEELHSSKHAEYAWPFYKPVNPKLLGCPDYFDVIKRPMDLGTVKDKLKRSMYGSPLEFASDVRLIFTNCYKYHLPEDEIVQKANQLRGIFEILYSRMPEDPESMKITMPTKRPCSGRTSCSKENMDCSLSIKQLQQEKTTRNFNSLSQKKRPRKSNQTKCVSSNEMDDVDILSITSSVLSPSHSTSTTAKIEEENCVEESATHLNASSSNTSDSSSSNSINSSSDSPSNSSNSSISNDSPSNTTNSNSDNPSSNSNNSRNGSSPRNGSKSGNDSSSINSSSSSSSSDNSNTDSKNSAADVHESSTKLRTTNSKSSNSDIDKNAAKFNSCTNDSNSSENSGPSSRSSSHASIIKASTHSVNNWTQAITTLTNDKNKENLMPSPVTPTPTSGKPAEYKIKNYSAWSKLAASYKNTPTSSTQSASRFQEFKKHAAEKAKLEAIQEKKNSQKEQSEMDKEKQRNKVEMKALETATTPTISVANTSSPPHVIPPERDMLRQLESERRKRIARENRVYFDRQRAILAEFEENMFQ